MRSTAGVLICAFLSSFCFAVALASATAQRSFSPAEEAGLFVTEALFVINNKGSFTRDGWMAGRSVELTNHRHGLVQAAQLQPFWFGPLQSLVVVGTLGLLGFRFRCRSRFFAFLAHCGWTAVACRVGTAPGQRNPSKEWAISFGFVDSSGGAHQPEISQAAITILTHAVLLAQGPTRSGSTSPPTGRPTHPSTSRTTLAEPAALRSTFTSGLPASSRSTPPAWPPLLLGLHAPALTSSWLRSGDESLHSFPLPHVGAGRSIHITLSLSLVTSAARRIHRCCPTCSPRLCESARRPLLSCSWA